MQKENGTLLKYANKVQSMELNALLYCHLYLVINREAPLIDIFI